MHDSVHYTASLPNGKGYTCTPPKEMHKQEHNAVTGSNCLTFMNENEISSRSSGLKDVDISDPGVTALEIRESSRGISVDPPYVLMKCMNP